MSECTHRRIQSWKAIDGDPLDFWSCVDCGRRFEPLSEAAPAAQPVPLTNEEMYKVFAAVVDDGSMPTFHQFMANEDNRLLITLAHAIEAAHGIGSKR